MASNWQETYEKLKKRKKALPKKTTSSTKKKDDEDDKWFKSGAFDDGYQIGDITKTILGTAGDVAVGAVKGIGNLAEGVLDLGTYAASGVADLFGNEEAAERIKKQGQKTLVNDWLEPLENKVDKNSLLGGKADNITQGLGYVGGILLTGGLGAGAGLGKVGTTALTTGLTGVSGMGSGMSEAYQGGATDKEAATFGTIAGLAEAGTELLFGGLGKAVNATGLSVGLSSADDMLAKKISSKFSNQIAKNFAEYGVKAGAEGLEEVMSGFIQGVGKYYTYQTEQDGFNLKQIIEDENLLDQFIAGAVTSGIAQSGIVPGMKNGSLIEANKAGRDFVTGFTQNEQAVIDAEIAARTEGKQLTKKQKSKIEAEVIEDFEKGYISTDTIESTLGGDTYNSLKSLRDNKTNLETQIKELESKPNAEITVKEMEQLKALREELKKVDTNTLESKLQAEMGQKIQSDAYLQRSYQEKAKRSQEFTYETTEKDSQYRKGVMESTKGKLNDTTRSHETAEALVKLSEDRQMQYKFTNNAELTKLGLVPEGKTANGLYVVDKDGSREILVNTDSKKYIEAVLVHETAHDFQTTSPETYTKLQDITREFAEAQNEYSRIYSEVAGMYKNVEGVDINEEVTSRLLEDYLGNKDFINSLTTKEPSIVKKIIDEVKYLVKKFTAGSPEARKLVELQHNLEKTYREAYKQTKATETTEGTKYSVSDANFSKSKVTDDKGNLLTLYHGTNGNFDTFENVKTEPGYWFTEDKEYASEHGKNLMEVNLNLTNPLDINTIEGEDILWDTAREVYGKQQVTEKEVLSNKVRDRLIELGYDGMIWEHSGKNTYIAFEPSQIRKINVKYSLDNQGRELSKGQIEYFKDSKVRDEKGNLLTVYHGTPNGGFNIYDTGMLGNTSGASDTSLGFHLTDNKELGELFSTIVNERIENQAKQEIYKKYGISENEILPPEMQKKIKNEIYERAEEIVNQSGEVKEHYIDIKKPLSYFADYGISEQQLADDLVYAATGSYDIEDTIDIYDDNMDFLKAIQQNFDNARQEFKYELSRPESIQRIKEMGYDGLILPITDTDKTSIENKKGNEYIVFNSNQIKNVDNLNPTDNPDVRYSLSDNQEERISKLKNEYELLDKTREVTFDERDALREELNKLIRSENYKNASSKFMEMVKSGLSPDEISKIQEYQLMAEEEKIRKKLKEYDVDIKVMTEDMTRISEMIEKEEKSHRNPKTAVKQAKEFFGLTNDFREAGYLLQDGTLLDFSGRSQGSRTYGRRTLDHREINEIGYDMNEFIELGNIRMKPESSGFELSKPLTKEQKSIIRDYLDTLDDDIMIDITKEGKVLYDSAVYKKGTQASKIFNDLDYYFENGKFPKQSEFAQFRYSLSKETDIAPTSTRNQTAAQDIRLQVEEAIAPLQEEITQLKQELQNTTDIDYAPATQEVVEAQDREAFNTLDDADIPTELEEIAPTGEQVTPTDSLFDTRDYEEVGSKKVNAYQYDNPEVRPYFQTAAREMLTDLQNSTRGERFIIGDNTQLGDNDYYYSGTKRATTEDIAELLDGMDGKYKYTYADIEKGLRAIIEDNGAENNAVSKRIEFYLDKRLREGYTDIDGYEIPADTEYLDMLRAKGITDYYNNIPLGEAPVSNVNKPVDNVSNNEIAPTKLKVSEAIRPAPDKDTHGHRLVRVKTDAELQTETNEEIAKILTEEPKVENNRNKRKWAILKANVLDKGIVFEDVALKHKNRELMGKWDYTLTSEARGQNVIGNGHYEYDPYSKTQRQVSKSLNDIRAEVDNTGLTSEFYEYIYHKHNVDRMRLEGRYEGMENKPVFGYNVTAEDSQQVVNKYESQHPEFITFAQDVYDYLDADRQVLVDNGVISQETADLWKSMYPHYVPIRRAGHTGSSINVPLDTGRTGVNAPIKKATGGNKDILPLFDTMASRTLQTYRATAKNSFGVELKNTIGTTINSQATNIDEVIDSVDAQEELLQEGKNGQKPTFTVFENGEKVTFEITEDMYDALKPLDSSSILSKTYGLPSNISGFHRGVLTQYNPVFMLTNAIKDSQDILINSQHAAKTYAKVPEATAQLISKGYWYQEYMNNGGEHNSYFDSVDNTFTTENKGLKKVLDLPPLKQIAQMNNFVEIIPRLAEYIASREAGRSIEVSMLDAARVTTNFKAGGNLTKFLNRNGATFLNASVQGAMQQVRNIREANANGIRGWANLATKFAIAGLPAILLNSLIWDDDEEYEELSDYVKQNYYIVSKTEDGTFIRIPKGRTVAVIQEGVRQMQNLATGDDEADLKTFLDLFITNLAPNNPIDNNVLSPIVQVAKNETWYGEDLVPTRLQDLPAAEQYDESTDSFSRWLGKMTNFSPVKINYLLDQYTGGVGDVVLPMMTPEAKSDADTFGEQMLAPLKSKFTANATMNNQNVADFYDTSEKLTTEAKKSTATDEDVLRNKYINSVKAEMNELYAEKREIQNSDLSNSEKYNRVLEVQKQINELSKEALNEYKNVDIYSNYATAGDRQYRLTDDGEWQKINDKQLEKQDNVTSTLGISPNDYWSNKEEYDYAYENPSKYALANAISDYSTFRELSSELYDIKADKDENGKSISGSRKEKVFDYINNLDLDFEQKVMLAKLEYPSYNEYNYEIIEYLNNREDINYEQMVSILTELGFTVKKDGTITWD